MRKLLAGANVPISLALICLLGVPGGASASPSARAEAEAKEQLRDVERAFSGTTSVDPTVELRDLAFALPSLDGAAERRARAILARPPDGNGPFGGAWPNNAQEQTVETPSFIVHYAEVPGCDAEQPNPDDDCDEPDLSVDEDSNDIPDYVDATIDAVNESIAVENVELGWPYPKGDGDEGEPNSSSEEDRFDVYLSDLCDESDFDPCIFGYAQPDDNSATCNSPPFLCSAHVVLDNDYEEFGSSGGELGLRVTTAHEYNHALQFNLDSNQDAWMFESTATWSEEQVFPADDDWVRSYMDSWAQEPQVPITKATFPPFELPHYYGSAVWNHWLENGDNSYGPDVILNAWESSRDVTPKDYAVGAYDDAIEDEGGAGFPQEFAAFTAATAEWNTGEGSLPDAAELPRVTRKGALSVGGKKDLVLDNTSYALYRVNANNAGNVRLVGRSSGSVQWSIALVGRTGGRINGNVERILAYSDGDGAQSVSLPDAQSFKRITAVVTNADGSVSGTKPTFGEFNYTRNNEEFRLKVR